MRRRTTGTLLVLGAAAGFGTIGIFGKLARAAALPLGTLLPVRFALATALVLALAMLRGWNVPRSARQWAATLGLGLVYTGLTLSYFTSLRFLPAGLATVVLYTYPAFVVVLSVALHNESATVSTLAALACAVTGVALVVGVDPSLAAPRGVALALAAAGLYAVYTVGSRSVVATLSPRALMIGALVGTTISMTCYGVVSGDLAVPHGEEWVLIGGLAVVGTVLPLVLFYEGVERLPASTVGIVSTAEPVVTVCLGALLLGEPVTPGVVAGGTFILGAVIIVQRTRGQPRPPTELTPPEDAEP